jgi:DNA polymerase III delta prime subunit
MTNWILWFDLLLNYWKKALDTLVTCSEGDLRKAITYLQCAARLKIDTGCIKSSDILEIAGVRKPIINQVFTSSIYLFLLIKDFERFIDWENHWHLRNWIVRESWNLHPSNLVYYCV